MNFPLLPCFYINVLTFCGRLDIIGRHKNANDPLAQPVEHLTFNQRARGSSPRRVTKEKAPPYGGAFSFVVTTHSNPRKCAAFSQGFACRGYDKHRFGAKPGFRVPDRRNSLRHLLRKCHLPQRGRLILPSVTNRGSESRLMLPTSVGCIRCFEILCPSSFALQNSQVLTEVPPK